MPRKWILKKRRNARSKRWGWQLRANGRVIARSAVTYRRLVDCERGCEAVRACLSAWAAMEAH